MRRSVPPALTRAVFVRLLFATSVAIALALSTISAQIPGRNVNMVSGTTWPEGDPFLQRQNEPSLAASTRNPLHLLGGSNDYRTVDVPGLCTPDPETGECAEPETGDAWLGLFKSTDGGQRWTSSLLPGYPQDQSPAGLASPLKDYKAGADAVVRAGTHGMIYYSGLVFDRTTNGRSGIFLARFVDNNNQEAGDPFKYLGTSLVAQSGGEVFLDKPWMAVDMPRNNSVTCSVNTNDLPSIDQPGRGDENRSARGNERGGRRKNAAQRIPAGAIYVAYTVFDGNATIVRSHIQVRRSMDCGVTWSEPIRVSRVEDQVNQGSSLTIDPKSGAVYIGYRRFDPDLTDTNDLDAIMLARLPYGGSRVDTPAPAHKFARPTRKVGRQLHRLFEHRESRFTQLESAVVSEEVDQFDLGTSGFNFRTNAYPTLAADGTGRIYMAWTQRGYRSGPTNTQNGEMTDGARVVIVTTRDGKKFTTPLPVDNHNTPGRGHQLMPSMTFAGGKLMLVYYDLRNTAAQTFNRLVSDLNTNTGLRQTIDIRSAMATAGDNPQFAPSVKVSDYMMGINPRSGQVEELQVNPPNLPMFKLGTVPFIGDYIDVAPAPAFIPVGNNRWAYNTESSGIPPVFHAAWTDNRDVRPPVNGDWTKYTPAQMSPDQGARTSLFDPTQTIPECSTQPGNGNPGSRNQNVYSSRITGGLLAGSPGNAKPLSTGLQRGFVVFAQNTTEDVKSFRMSILNQPPGGRASFEQFPLPPYTAASPAAETAIEMIVPARSTASRTVYVTSSNPDATINVDVVELVDLRTLSPAQYPNAPAQPDGSVARVVLNPDIENPDIENPDIENPDIENPDIENAEVTNPDIENPDIENPDIENPDIENVRVSNPDIENPDIENPDIENPDIENVQVANPDIENPDIENPDIENPDIENPDIENPDIENPDIENGSIADITWQVTNTGNTTAAFNVNLFLSQQQLPQGIATQLILLKTYRTPVSVPNGCQLGFQTRNILLTSIRNPVLVPPNGGTADQNDPSETNATLWLAPGEEGRIVMRVIDDDISNNVLVPKTNPDGTPVLDDDGQPKMVLIDPGVIPSEDVSPLVQQQAVNTTDAESGITEPPVVPPPAPKPTDDEAWTSANTPVYMNVLRNDAAVWGSTKIQTQNSPGLWRPAGNVPELVFMPTTGLLYGGGIRGVSVIDPVSRKLTGVLPIEAGDPPLSYGVASAQAGLLFFRSGVPVQPTASLYIYDVRPGSPTFHQYAPVAPAARSAIDALGSAFTFALNQTGTVLYYAAGTLTQQTIAAIDANPLSATFAQILWQLPMPANGQVRQIVENPATGKIYVAIVNSGPAPLPGGGVYVIDGGAVVKITGATQSAGLAINPATNLIYSAGISGTQYQVNAIDGATDTLITLLPAVAGPVRLGNNEHRIRIHYGTGKVFLRSATELHVYNGAKGSASFNSLLATFAVGTEALLSEVAVNQSTGVVATAGNFFHKITLIDAVTNAVQELAVPRAGFELEFDTVTGRLFFADSLGSILEISPAAVGVAAVNWALSVFPETSIPIVNPVTGRAYVGTGDVQSSIDVYSSAGRLGPVSGLTLDQGRWGFAARHQASNTFFFVNSMSNLAKTQVRPGVVAAVNGATDAVVQMVETSGSPFGVGVNQSRNQVYVVGFGGLDAAGTAQPGQIRVHDGGDLSVSALADTSAFGTGVAFGRHVEVLDDRAYVLVTSPAPLGPVPGSPASVAFLDGTLIPGPSAPVAQPLEFPAPLTSSDRADVIRVNTTNGYVYFGLFNTTTNAYTVVAMDRATHTVVGTIAAGGHSRMHTASWLAVNPATNRLYVVNFNADSIQMYDATTLAPMGAPVSLPDGPSAMALNLSANRVYVSSINAKQVTALDGNTLAVLSSVRLPLHAFFLSVNESEGRIYTAGGNSFDESGVMVVSDVDGVLGTNVDVTTTSTPAGGAVALLADDSIVYTPMPGFSGDDTFTYTTLTAGGAATATVTVHVIPATHSPVANDDAFVLAPAAASLVIAPGDLLKNDVYMGAAPISIVSGPSNGNLIPSAVAPGGFDYVPNAGFSGSDSFRYSFLNGVASNPATVSIWVTPSASPLVVSNAGDSGPGSLRNAMTFANSNPGVDTITFNIPGAGPAAPILINVASPLPQITDSVVIDGRTQPGWSVTPLITVRGPSTTTGWIGLNIGANMVTVAGLAITNFMEGVFTPQTLHSHVLRDSLITGNVRGIQWRSSGGHIYRNVIGGNGEGLILNFSAAGNVIEENRVGMQANGVTPLGNTGNGIVMYDGVNGTQVLNNIISGNGGWGVDIQHSGVLAPVTGTVFRNNAIGLDINGNLVLFGGDNIIGQTSYGPIVDFGPENRGNAAGGIHLNNAPDTTIGGTVSTGNTISGNSLHGVLIDNTPVPGVLIRGNIIGLDPSGNNHRGNTRNGISVVASVATIGGTNSGEGNTVSGNIVNGIAVFGNSALTTIVGNKIGTTLSGLSITDGTMPLGNGKLTDPDYGCCHAGVFLNSAGVIVQNNVIAGNMMGVRSTSPAGGTGNLIANNYIGTGTGGAGALANTKGVFLAGDLSGTRVVANTIWYSHEDGVLIAEGSFNTTIGGSAPNGNNIALNQRGIVVGYNAGTADANHVITFNLLSNNTEMGLDLGDDGVTANDAGDGDGGPNGLQNYPVIVSATLASGTDITIDTTSFANTSHTVQFFSVPSCDANGFGEGGTFIGEVNVTAPGIQNVNFPVVVPAGYLITATATGPNGTSEFSACKQVVVIAGSISSATPNPFGTGFGQLVTLEGTGMMSTDASHVIFTQGANSWPAAYAWQTSATRIIARAPTQLVPGVPTTVRATNGAVHTTPPFAVTVSAAPGAPTLHTVHSGSCTGGFNATAVTTTTAGASIVIEATGVDSNGGDTTFVWTPLSGGAATTTTGAATCGGPSGRVYTTSTVPAIAAGTPVRLEVRTTTTGGTSPVSNGILLTVEGSVEGQFMSGASGTFSGGVVVPEGYAMTALRGTISGGNIEGVNSFASPLAYPMAGGEVNNYTFGGNTGAAYDLSCPASMVMTGISGSLTGINPAPGNLTQLSVQCKTPSDLNGAATTIGPVGTPSASPFSVSCSAGKKVIIVQAQVSSIMHGIGVICR